MSAPTELGVDAAAPRPPVGFRFDVPDAWTVLDLAPATSDAWVEAFLDERSAGVPGAAAQRARARQVLRQAIASHRSAGVLFAAFLAARVSSPAQLVGASLTLAWRELRGGRVDLDGLARFMTEDDPAPGEDLAARSVTRVALRPGDAVRVASRQLTLVPLTSTRRPVAIVQHLVPVPDLPWLGVLTATTPNLELAGTYAELADVVAASFELLDASGAPLRPSPPTGTIGYLPS